MRVECFDSVARSFAGKCGRDGVTAELSDEHLRTNLLTECLKLLDRGGTLEVTRCKQRRAPFPRPGAGRASPRVVVLPAP